MSTPWIVGARDLTSAELGLLRTLLRLSTELAGRWTLNDDGDCDVLLSGNGSDATEPDQRRGARVVVPVLARGEPANGMALARPFRAEEFIALLGRVERLLAPPAIASASSAAAPRNLATASESARAQLKRWPPAALLRGQRERIQLATMIARGARTIHELSNASQQPIDVCKAFIAELDQMQLLAWRLPEVSVAAAGTTMTMALATGNPQAEASPLRGLFRSIRRRLGLI